MALSLKESRALTEAAKVLYRFLPGSGSAGWKGHITFATVARSNGVGEFWVGGSKEPAIARLLELTLERRKDRFEPLILEIVKEGLKYCQKNNSPITASEIVTLNGLIKEVGFKFPFLWDEEFLNALKTDGATRASKIVDDENQAANLRATQRSQRGKEIEILKNDFFALAAATDRNKAGLEFERLLTRIFELFELEPRLSFRVTGEQIDGSFKLDNEIYLVEAKWEANKMGEQELAFFRSKVEGKSSTTRGIFIAANGYTEVGLSALVRGKQPNFFLMDGYDLSIVLHGHITLDAMLRQKHRRFAEEGLLLHRIKLE